jgi:hypothetical protein
MTDLIPLGALIALPLFMYVGRRRISRLGMLLAAAATVGLGWWVVTHTHWLLLAGLVLAGVVAAVGVLLRATRSESVVTRWGNRVRSTSGVATTVDILRNNRLVRRQGAVVRPSLFSR